MTRTMMTRTGAALSVSAALWLGLPAQAQEAPPHTPSTTAQALLGVGKPVVGSDGKEVGRIVEVTRQDDGTPTGVLIESSREAGALGRGQLVEVPLDLLFTDGVVIGLDLTPGTTGPDEPSIPLDRPLR